MPPDVMGSFGSSTSPVRITSIQRTTSFRLSCRDQREERCRALVPGEPWRRLDQPREHLVRLTELMALHCLDAFQQQGVELRIARLVPHLPQRRGGSRCLLGIVAAEDRGEYSRP